MNREGYVMPTALSRRQFLARQGVAVGGMAAAWLLGEDTLHADSAASRVPEPKDEVLFPLKVGENRRYLVDSRSKPFFLLGDTPWFLQKIPLEDVRRVLEDRKAKGFNALFLEILDDSRLPSRDAYGNVAFEPELDITRPVEAYWRYADTIMEEIV